MKRKTDLFVTGRSRWKTLGDKRLSYRRETRATLCVSWNVVLLLYK